MNEVIGVPQPEPEPESDHLRWARGPERRANLLRQVALQKGYNVSRVILGDVLLTITGDDLNCFGVSRNPFVPRNAAIGKEQLLIRLNWEINTPELPGQIKKRLRKVKKDLVGID